MVPSADLVYRRATPPPRPFVDAVLAALASGSVTTKEGLHALKLRLARDGGLPAIPSDADILSALAPSDVERWRPLLALKATRTLSGVAIVTVQSSPEACPHGRCIYCPGGPSEGSAQAYTGFEPAALRAKANGFDPYRQTASRLAQLATTGHHTDKVDLIVQGGTFTARDLDYQEWFVKRCLDAMNEASAPGAAPGPAARSGGESRNRFGTPGALTLDEALLLNESAACRMIGLTIETKPDWFLREHVDAALAYGTTRVELGIQTVHEEVQRRTNRGHGMAESVEATRLAKEAGLKLCYHMMPGLPGSDRDKDRESFRRIFEDPALRPDMVKIYPTLVMPRTPLHEMWERGLFRPLSTEEAAELVADAKEMIPPWVRIQRVDRDIPVPLIAGGVDKANLRQLAVAALAKRGKECRCVRCREVGHYRRAHGEPGGAAPEAGDERLVDTRYEASGGVERFLSLEDPRDRALLAYLRVRILGDPWRPELRSGDAMVRELKVPGAVVPIGVHDDARNQHRGRGARLLEVARDVAASEGAPRLFVRAGAGVKPYYRKMGFRDEGAYQVLGIA